MTIWEHRRILKDLKTRGMEHVDENMIFDTYAELKHLEEKASGSAAAARRRRNGERKDQAVKSSIKNEFIKEEPEAEESFEYNPDTEYLPFEELIHDPFNSNKKHW